MAIELKPLNIKDIRLCLLGISPLLVHGWSEKARKMMLDKQLKKASTGRAIRDPEGDVLNCFYPPADDGTSPFGFKAIAFKAAMVTSARTNEGIAMTQLRAAVHIPCEYVPIYGIWEAREDTVNVGRGASDLRFRPMFRQWATILPVRFNADFLSEEQVLSLFNAGGFSTGVGDWRPEKDGNFGMFAVANESDIQALIDVTPDSLPGRDDVVLRAVA